MQNKIHCFDIDTAVSYGIEKAILLQNLKFWLDKEYASRNKPETDTKGNEKVHAYNGKVYVWTYNSARAFGELFPYMNEKSIQKWLLELERDGVIISSQFNQNKYDKTKWFTMPEYEILGSKTLAPTEQSEEILEQSNAPMEQTIPDINTDINIYNIQPHAVEVGQSSKKLKKPKAPKRDSNELINWEDVKNTLRQPDVNKQTKIVLWYIETKNITCRTYGEWKSISARLFTAANRLTGYSVAEAEELVQKFQERNLSWTLETLANTISNPNI